MAVPQFDRKTNRKRILCIAAYSMILFSAVVPSIAQAGTALNGDHNILNTDQMQPAFHPPRYDFIRHREDWSALRYASKDEQRQDFWYRIKYIPLSQNPGTYATLGGELRGRYEKWRHWIFMPTNNDSFLLWRLMAHGDFHFNDKYRLYIEGKTALATNRSLPGGRRVFDHDTLALQQLFVDIPFGNDFILRPGRQMFSFGKERLVSPNAWSNTLNTWDGVSLIINKSSWRATAFYSEYVAVRQWDFNKPTHNRKLGGVYANTVLPTTQAGLDLYWLYNDTINQVFDAMLGRDKRHTLGAHVFGKFLERYSASYDLEGAWQLGSFGATRDVSAYMLALASRYEFQTVRTTPSVYVAWDYASGSNGATDPRMRTFNQLYPSAQTFLGFAEMIGRQNISDIHGGIDFKPVGNVKAGMDYHFFQRAHNSDGWYDAYGTQRGLSGASSSAKIGNELDLFLKAYLGRHAIGKFGLSHFNPGRYLTSATANNSSVEFGYLQIEYVV